MSDKETRFLQSALESQRGGLNDLGKALIALKKASTLSGIGDLDDILLQDPQVGEVLKYNGTSWVNGTAVAGEGTFQAQDATLTALAALDPNVGLIYQTGPDVFEKKTIGTGGAQVAAGDHNHNATYSLLGHDHNGVYSPVGHNHDGTYALATHYHDETYAPLSHNHDTYYISVITTPTAGNFPVIDANGELTTSAYSPSSFVTSARTVSTQYSLTGGGDLSANRTLSLVGDIASPGAFKIYGTDINGTRGWYDAPTSEGGEPGAHNHDTAYISIVAAADAGNFPVLTAGGELVTSSFSSSSFAASGTSISTQHSLTGGGNLTASRTLSLVGDAASPGNSKVYGTNSSGVRGWYDAPTGGSGSSTLDGLTDVTLSTPVNNQVLQYNSGTGQWVNGAGLGTNVLFGTDAGTVCEGNDDRIPDATEQSFLAMVTKSGDSFTITPAGAGTITFEAGSIIVRGNLVITDGTNTVTITPTTELVAV